MSGMISYAQNFEDVMLERLFADQAQGFYVDVGAWDPDCLSVTKHFYLRGWNGINIEPIPARSERFRSARPRDVNLNVAIAERPGDTAFWICRGDDALSTADADTAEALRAQGRSLDEARVPTRRLDDILAEHASAEIDFLKIDVEGGEADVIRSMSFRRFRPRALLIEATSPGAVPDWSQPEAIGTWQAFEPALFEDGYVFAHFDGLNRFYVRSEDRHLAARFALPPGVFDGIEEAGSNAGRSAMLLDQLVRSQADCTARLDLIHEISAKLVRSEATSAERLELIRRVDDDMRRLQDELARSQAENSARMTSIERLEDELSILNQQLRKLDRPTEALRHLGRRVRVSVKALRPASYRR